MNREPKAIGRLTAIIGILLANGALMVAGSFEEIQLDLSNPHMLLVAKLMQIFGVFLTFILPALLIAIFLTGSGVRYLGLTGKVKPVYFLLALLLILFSMPLIGVLEEWNKHMVLPSSLSGIEGWMRSSEDKAGKLTEAMLKSAGIGDLMLNLFIVAFMAAVSEELFFRGLVQNVCREWFKNYHVAVWVTAFIFSAFHMEFYGFLPRMLLGLFLGYLYVWSGSVYISMLAHFANNAMGVIAFYLTEHKLLGAGVETSTSSGGSVAVTGVSAALTLLLVYMAWKIRKQEEVETDTVSLNQPEPPLS